MKKLTLILLAIVAVKLGTAQSVTKTFEHGGVSYQYEALNEVVNPKGLLVLFNGGAGVASQIVPETAIPAAAVDYQLTTIGIDQSEFFISDATYVRLRTIIKNVMEENGIKGNLFIGGFSLGGFTAVRFAEMAVEKQDSSMIPNAVFAIDPPLDHLDFVNYCLRELNRNCPDEAMSKLGKDEAEWVLNYYLQHFGDFKKDSAAYIANSCFTAGLADGGNGKYLKTIPVNMIHEIDMMWLIEERCRDLSDANAVLSSKFVNYLYQAGNKNAIITLTTNIGYRSDGRRHPHSWSIADPTDTLNWLKRFME
jgi:hypothetical protein